LESNQTLIDQFFYRSLNFLFEFFPDGTIKKANPAFLTFIGRENFSIEGESFFNYVHLNDRKMVEEVFNSLPAKEFSPVTIRLNHQDIFPKYIYLQSLFLFNGMIYAIAINNTEEIRIKSELEEYKIRLLNIINFIPHPIFLKDRNSKYILANKAQADLFSTTIDDLLGKDDYSFVLNKTELKAIQESDLKVLQSQVLQIIPDQEVTRLDGKKMIMHTSKLPFYSEANHEILILGVSIDMTDIKNYESELLKINFELDTFVYKASHDLKAPMCSIEGLLNLLKIEPDDEMKKIYIEKAEANIKKLESFITDLTNYSRNTRLNVRKEKVNISEIVNSSIEELGYMQNANRLSIKVNISSQDFYSDATRLKILFMNLISNAIKYQKLTEPNPYLIINIETDPEKANITFKDNGIGIDKHSAKKIFEMFFRASENSQGAGLGLYIVKQIIDKLEGEITVKSKLDEGTQFNITLKNFKNSIDSIEQSEIVAVKA
jgi:PAS domain S-box-containing protein